MIKKHRLYTFDKHGNPILDLVPLNPDFEMLHSVTWPITVIGTMVEHCQYRRQR
jgi:SOS-response transcriptional repressor LexA